MASATTKMTALLLIGLVIGLVAGYSVASMAVPPKPTGPTIVTYPIGVEVPLTGVMPGFGTEQKEAALLAISDMNAFLDQTGSNVRFTGIVADDGATPDGAVKAVTSLVETSGVQVIAGPPTSGAALADESYVCSHHIPMITSTASSAALSSRPAGCIFRMWASDKYQGKAMIAIAAGWNVKNVVLVWRDDAYGKGIRDTIVDLFKGGLKEVRVTPGLADYSSEVAEMDRDVNSFGANSSTALIMVIWESETTNFLGHVKSYPELANVRWIYSDSVTNPGILPPASPPDFASYLMNVNVVGTTAHYSANPVGEKVLNAMKTLYGATDTESLYMYDAAYIAMLAVLLAGQYNGQAIANAIPVVASHYYGASGWKLLDDIGDLAYQTYDLVSLVQTGQSFSWNPVGLYDPNTGITWVST